MSLQPQPSFASKRKALRSQMMQQVEMFDRLADPLLQVTGRKGRIKWANQAALNLLGSELTNRRLTEVFASKALKPALKKLREGDDDDLEEIVSAQNFPGREFRVRLARLDKKTLYGARTLIAITDVTEVLQLQAQRADFVANASHELKTPVSSLSGFIETLEQDPKALETFLPLMSREAERMRALIRDLLRLTKTEMETGKAPTAWIDPLPLVQQATDGLAYVVERRLQKIAITPLEEPVLVRGDSIALTTVFTNLLQNASKYAPDGTPIEVDAELRGDHLHLNFRNEGKGIEAKHIPRLTERFYRVDDGRARKEGGTGLGLAIVKHVLIRHKGQLHIASAPDKGACFTVVLPAKISRDF